MSCLQKTQLSRFIHSAMRVKLFDIAHVSSYLNAQSKLVEMSQMLFLRKAVSVPYKNAHVLISILYNI